MAKSKQLTGKEKIEFGKILRALSSRRQRFLVWHRRDLRGNTKNTYQHLPMRQQKKKEKKC